MKWSEMLLTMIPPLRREEGDLQKIWSIREALLRDSRVGRVTDGIKEKLYISSMYSEYKERDSVLRRSILKSPATMHSLDVLVTVDNIGVNCSKNNSISQFLSLGGL